MVGNNAAGNHFKEGSLTLKPSDLPEWKPTACMLCSIGCAIEVQVEGRRFEKIRGDRRSPASRGYICQKAARLDHYQNHAMRLKTPLRRREDGQFEEVSWETALSDIANKIKSIKSNHGGKAFAYYGGGGQGNHLGGTYSAALRSALGTPYLYSALAQEKTGDFWINGKLFGRQSCYAGEGVEHSDYAIVIGANPYSAHGFPRTRDVLREYKRDPSRTLVVIDPRATETARSADIFLQLRPGTDAYLLSAMISVIFREGLQDVGFLIKHTEGADKIKEIFLKIPIEEYAECCGVPLEMIQKVARGFAGARCATVQADLGIQQSLNSTLNSYLEKLLFLVTGNFNREGGNHLVPLFAPLIGHSKSVEEGAPTTMVTGMHPISKLYPPNILPKEIDSNHPDRVRALFVDSANPALSGADTQAYEAAFKKLELLVVIDVAMTETARAAHYVLPAQSQFEKCEASFFTFGFPTSYFHIRHPILEHEGDALPEAEIYRRLLVAMGEMPDRFPALERVAKLDRKMPWARLYPMALAAMLKVNPKRSAYLPVILYATLGKALPEGLASAASIWGVCQFYAAKFTKQLHRSGLKGEGVTLANALFNRCLESGRSVPLGTFTYEETWGLMRTPDKRVKLYIKEMAEALKALETAESISSGEYPFILMAGERRAYNANQIYRTPDWRKTDKEGAMRLHPNDCEALGVNDGDMMICRSARGSIEIRVSCDDTVQPGMVTLPHGYGMLYENEKSDELVRNGPAINELTDADHSDPIAKTPFHKYVRVALERIEN